MIKEKNTSTTRLTEPSKPTENIPYRFSYWGPFVFRSKILPAECKMILAAGKKCRKKANDYRDQLAGQLSDEYKLQDRQEFSEWLEKYLQAYAVGYNKWRGGEATLSNLKLHSLWINYMKAGDFNPPHHHDGDLSFVIYPFIPQKLIKENKAYTGTSIGPGGIAWIYGLGLRRYIDTSQHMPETGDIYIFPASLKHWVYPFRSKIERISVSGNIFCDTFLVKKGEN